MFKTFISKLWPLFDKFSEKLISRKFLVFIIATHMTYLAILDSAHWMNISLLYIGAEAILDYNTIKKVEPSAKILPE